MPNSSLLCTAHNVPHHPAVPPQSYAGISWSTWMVSISILWAPFWFNPQTFQVGGGQAGVPARAGAATQRHRKWHAARGLAQRTAGVLVPLALRPLRPG